MPEPETVIPIVEETARLGKRRVETGRVIVRKSVANHDETIEQLLQTEELEIERVPVNRVVTQAPPMREEGDLITIPVLEEQLVVETRLVLKEEVRIRRIRKTQPARETVRLRREAVVVEQRPAPEQHTKEGTEMAVTQDSMGATTSMAGQEYRIVAMYETYDRAREARARLLEEGIAASDVDILNRDAPDADANFRYERTDDGFWGAIKRFFVPEEDTHLYTEGLRRGHAMVVVRPQPAMHERAMEILESLDPIDFDAREEEWQKAGWTGTAPVVARPHAGHGLVGRSPMDRPAEEQATAAAIATPEVPGEIPGAARPVGVVETETTGTPAVQANADQVRTGEEEVLPVVEEQVRVGKRQVSRGAVRVRSYVLERPVQEDVTLREETIDVERRPVDRPTSGLPADAFEERTIEVTATGEEPVVAKEARVVEEVAIRKREAERTETVHDTERKTEVEVEDDRTHQAAAIPPKPVKP